MSARALIVATQPPSASVEALELHPMSQGPPMAVALSATLAPPALAVTPEDSARFIEELLRRYEAPYPVSWRLGGIRE
jgi:hypothetical protein